MTGPPKDIVVAKHASPLCQGDSHLQSNDTKLFHRSGLQKSLSEYQSAYQRCTWQPVRQCLKPRDNTSKNIKSTDKLRTEIYRKSTYGQDYIGYALVGRGMGLRLVHAYLMCVNKVHWSQNGSAQWQQYHEVGKTPKPKKHKMSLTMPEVSMDTSTTYMAEYYSKRIQKPEPIHPEHDDVIQIPADEEFQGQTIYQASYPVYDVHTIIASQGVPIKAKENVVILQSLDADRNPQSTAQLDFVHHVDVQRPIPMYQNENTEISTDPLNARTEYKDYYTNKFTEQVKNIMVRVKPNEAKTPGAATSTAMADYTDPKSTTPPRPIRQKASPKLMTGPFDGRTTNNMAYKEWPLQPYELPIWAKKPKYKRSDGGMILNSVYTHDFMDPNMISEEDLIQRDAELGQVVMPGEGDVWERQLSTYKRDFRSCEGVVAPRSFNVREKYKPPKTKMMCETNHRSQFTGLPSDRMKMCRHPSQHRELNRNKRMTFLTTYTDMYQDPRPKSSPISNSAPEVVPRLPRSAKVRGTDTPPMFQIAHMDLQSIPVCNVGKLKIAAPSTTPPNTPDKTQKSRDFSEVATRSLTPQWMIGNLDCDNSTRCSSENTVTQ